MKVLILGAGGHARAMLDALRQNGYDEYVYFDDNTPRKLGHFVQYRAYSRTVFVALGDNAVRARYITLALANGFAVAHVQHPFCWVSPSATFGVGCALQAGCVVGAHAILQNGIIVNTGASVDHDCVLQHGVHIAVGAHVAGGVHIGENTLIGAGATVVDHVCIGANCIVGAGSVVVCDLPSDGVYLGVPAKVTNRA